jgi:hypothetical protein
LKVACVLKASKEYGVDYVENLRDGIAKHLPGSSFVCLSDIDVPCERIALKHDWPGWWSKMELLAPWIEGDLLYFDLDTIIVGDLSSVASVKWLTLLSDFYSPNRLASGVMFLPERERNAAWEIWRKEPEAHMRAAGGHGDGDFFDKLWRGKAARWQDILPGQIVSYKAHVRKAQSTMDSGNGSIPASASVVCFHGSPRPRDLAWKI